MSTTEISFTSICLFRPFVVRPLLVVAPAVRDELTMNTILASSDLDDALKSLDHLVAKNPNEPSASKVTVSMAGLRHLVLSGFLMKDHANEDQIGKMVVAGMVRGRDMFKNTKKAI